MLTTNCFSMYTGPSRSTGVSRAVALRTVRAFQWQCEEGVHQLTLEIMSQLPEHVDRAILAAPQLTNLARSGATSPEPWPRCDLASR